jgi:hypothetical protein
MNLDNPAALNAFFTEPCKVLRAGVALDIRFLAVLVPGGDPMSGGAHQAHQVGDQYVMKLPRLSWADPGPQVHDKIITTNFGTVDVKQAFKEGSFWSVMLTGETRNPSK